jgi:hypothetical protein
MRRMTLVVWVLAITPCFAAGGEDPKLQAAMELHKVASAADSASLVPTRRADKCFEPTR